MTVRTVKIQYFEDGVEVGHHDAMLADFPGVFKAIDEVVTALAWSYLHGCSDGKHHGGPRHVEGQNHDDVHGSAADPQHMRGSDI